MGDMIIKEDSFVRTAPVYQPGMPKRAPSEPLLNQQTVTLCEKLGIDDPVQVVMARSGRVMKQAFISRNNENSSISTSSPMMSTPVKSKLTLPEPMTPSANNDEVSEKDSFSSTQNSFLSESICSMTVECGTPVSAGPKKTFKRRNVAMYTPDADESVSTSYSSLDADSPRTSKLPNRDQ